ncbi:MAG: transporter related protein [Chloroflexi bacterium]|nr:transporter related protein [Chloroflexota bacterium]
MAELLNVRNLSLSFGGLKALDDVDLTVCEGSVTGLIGPNGAGKTSLLNCVCGFYKPQRGEVRLGSSDLLQLRPYQIVRSGLARTFQHVELFRSMTVLENVLVGAHTGHRPNVLAEAFSLPSARRATRSQRELARSMLQMLGLESYATHPATALPLGLQKRTGLARALISRPKLVLLDEPAGGLNDTEKRALGSLLRQLQAALGITILLIEHDMDLVMGLCDSITVLDFGKRIAVGSPAAIKRDPLVISAYLGVAGAVDASSAAQA